MCVRGFFFLTKGELNASSKLHTRSGTILQRKIGHVLASRWLVAVPVKINKHVTTRTTHRAS